jgi:hypothetical protein
MALTCLHTVAGNSAPIMSPVGRPSSILQIQNAGEATGDRLDIQVCLVEILISGLEECFTLTLVLPSGLDPPSYYTANLGPSPG